MRVGSRFSQLSPSRQALVRICQSTNYGCIEGLTVRDQEPILTSSSPLVLADIRLDVEERPRDELALNDFVLCAELHRLLSMLDQIENGRIFRIEIRAGLPRRVVLEKSASETEGYAEPEGGSHDQI